MCLAKPLKLLSIEENGAAGTVDAGGTELSIGLDLTPEAKVGDFVLVHAGVAIEVLEEQDAHDIIDAFDQYVHTADMLSPEGPPSDER